MAHACVQVKDVKDIRARQRKFLRKHICDNCPLWMVLGGTGTG